MQKIVISRGFLIDIFLKYEAMKTVNQQNFYF